MQRDRGGEGEHDRGRKPESRHRDRAERMWRDPLALHEQAIAARATRSRQHERRNPGQRAIDLPDRAEVAGEQEGGKNVSQGLHGGLRAREPARAAGSDEAGAVGGSGQINRDMAFGGAEPQERLPHGLEHRACIAAQSRAEVLGFQRTCPRL